MYLLWLDICAHLYKRITLIRCSINVPPGGHRNVARETNDNSSAAMIHFMDMLDVVLLTKQNMGEFDDKWRLSIALLT